MAKVGNGLIVTHFSQGKGWKETSLSLFFCLYSRAWLERSSELCLKSQISFRFWVGAAEPGLYFQIQSGMSWCAGHLVGMLARRVALDSCSIPATALLRKPKENLLNLQLQDNSFSA